MHARTQHFPQINSSSMASDDGMVPLWVLKAGDGLFRPLSARNCRTLELQYQAWLWQI